MENATSRSGEHAPPMYTKHSDVKKMGRNMNAKRWVHVTSAHIKQENARQESRIQHSGTHRKSKPVDDFQSATMMSAMDLMFVL